MEIFKDIPGYEGLYQVSNLGNINSFKNFGHKLLDEPVLLKPIKFKTNNKEYYRIFLRKNNKTKQYKVHQLVAMAFLGHKPDGTHKVVVNHIDNNGLNNNLNNLELVSQRHNSSCHKTDVGVSWATSRNKWLSSIRINRKSTHLGLFTDKQDALNIYQKALNNIHLYNGNAKAFREVLNNL